MIFSLNYQTMAQALQRMRYTGSVEARVPSGSFAKGIVFLEVQKGVIQSCFVITARGQQVNNIKLIEEQLARCGMLEWRLKASSEQSTSPMRTPSPTHPFPPAERPGQIPNQPPSPTPPESTVLSATCYPQHLPADSAWFSTWPFVHRQVYKLSTGKYSEQDIARLLHYSPNDLQKVFQELENLGVLKRGDT
jgi:hypothetical protein